MTFLRAPYNYDTNAASDEAGLECKDATRAQQSFKDECNINTILKRFGITGQLPNNVRMPMQGDFTEITDFKGAMNAIRQAQESFMEMPADVRKRFNNDPHEFVQFCNDEKNADEARKLGLVNPKAEPKPAEPLLVRIAGEPAAPPTPGGS